MAFNAILAVAIATLLVLVLLKVAAPRTYDKYVLRDTARPAPSRSSSAAAVIILAAMVFVGVNFGLRLYHDSRRNPVVHQPVAQHATAMRIEAWVGLFCVSTTGIILCLFPAPVTARLLGRRVSLSPADEEATRKIKAFGRVLGMVFLIAAILIARQLV